MRPEFQRDLWSLAVGCAALAAVMLSGALHKAGVPGRDVIGVAITFAVATALTLMIAELLDRLSRQSVQRAGSKRSPSPEVTENEPQRPVEEPSQRQQQGHTNDQSSAAERYHDE
ncbi:MAG: hypothetical protein JO237_11335 [Pseudolabrys sp.]|nr:hypothetical protein [Pseudolabrys sp.]